MRKEAVEILTTFVDDGRQADDLRARADDDEKFELSVVLELCHIFSLCFLQVQNTYPAGWDQRARSPTSE